VLALLASSATHTASDLSYFPLSTTRATHCTAAQAQHAAQSVLAPWCAQDDTHPGPASCFTHLAMTTTFTIVFNRSSALAPFLPAARSSCEDCTGGEGSDGGV
jgi:hypothetical protein